MWINNCFHILQAARAYLYGISVEYLMELVVRWKCLSNKDRKCFPTLVTTFALYVGLNHIIFLFWILLMLVFCLMFRWYRIWCLYPAFVSASLHGMIGFLNISSFADNCGNFNSIEFGSCLIMDDGWLGSALTWIILLLFLR